MEEVLRQRLIRKIESLPEEQVYQVLDYIEFLDIKYGAVPEEASGLQKFAEGIQDSMRKRAMNPSTYRAGFQILSTADKVFSSVSNAASQLMEDLTGSGEAEEEEGEGGSDAGEAQSADDEIEASPEATSKDGPKADEGEGE